MVSPFLPSFLGVWPSSSRLMQSGRGASTSQDSSCLDRRGSSPQVAEETRVLWALGKRWGQGGGSSRPLQAPKVSSRQLLHPQNRVMRPEGGALHHILRKLSLYPHFHLGPGWGFFNCCFFTSKFLRANLDTAVVKLTVISQPSRAVPGRLIRVVYGCDSCG